MEPRIRFYTRTRKFKTEVINRRGKKSPLFNLEKSCIINGLMGSHAFGEKKQTKNHFARGI